MTASKQLYLLSPKMRHLNETEVARAVALIENGQSLRQVARDLGVSSSAVHRVWNRYRETGQYRRRNGQGPKRKTTPQQDRFLVLSCLRERTCTARDLQSRLRMAHGTEISDQTVRNRLREGNLRPRRPVRVPRLTRQHRVARRNFAREHVVWQLRHWRSVLFTDESRFRLTRCDGRVRVYRRPGERYSAAAVQEVEKFGGGSVMVWGGISVDDRTDLVVIPGRLNAAEYINTVLEEHVVPAAFGVGEDFLFMQDNARPHVAVATMNFLREVGIEVMDWPALRPDLNPIEHVWDMLERRIRKRPNPPQTIQQLTQALTEEWERIPQEDLRKLVRSMTRRCESVIRAGGGHTRY